MSKHILHVIEPFFFAYTEFSFSNLQLVRHQNGSMGRPRNRLGMWTFDLALMMNDISCFLN